MLTKLINKKTVRLHVEVSTWQEAVKAAGDILVDNDAVEPGYINAMIENTIENGPYYVLVPGVAMPHGRSEQGVKKLAMSLITLKHPVRFLDSPNNPVKVVVCLAALNSRTHLEMLQEFSRFLSVRKDVDTVADATDPEEVMAVLNSYG